MLFDLRGRGRRRTVQVVYIGLALLMGVGFIGFGVGVGGGSGGLFDFLNEGNKSGSASFSAQISKQESILKKHPNDTAAWAALVNAQLHEAGGEQFSEQATGRFTEQGRELLSRIADSWNHYVALAPNPDTELAQRMLVVFSEEGLNQPASAVQALQIVVAAKPRSAALYGALAQYAYAASNRREGDLAAAKAVALAPSSERSRVRRQLEEIKRRVVQRQEEAEASRALSSASSSSTATAAR